MSNHTGAREVTPAEQHSEQAKPPAVYNERGVIAESYYDLQGLGVLDAMREANPLPKASDASMLRSIFQSVEITLLNLSDIIRRSTCDLAQAKLGGAMVKMSWARGFHRVLIRLSMMPHQLGLMRGHTGEKGSLRLKDSPAFREYVDALVEFDRYVWQSVESGLLPMHKALAEESLDSVAFKLVHLARVCNHESTVWERNLSEVRVPAPVESYEKFVVTDEIRHAVYERELKGDTYFTQFRGLHQVPETLGEEVNDNLEQAIRDIRGSRLSEAADRLRAVNILVEGMLASLPPMADNLATSDYHQIRENLGLTSGSHSVCLRFHRFTHLYEQLWDELSALLLKQSNGSTDVSVEEAIRRLEAKRHENDEAWLAHLLIGYSLQLRTFIFEWREEHLHMPRNNLGGESTKSLTGSPDAIKAVKNMRDVAVMKDPMMQLARACELATDEARLGELTTYLESDESLDSKILVATGRVTQERFHDVQERLGFFANRCQFKAPPRRTV